MSNRILVEHGYIVPDKYIDLEDYELICDLCRGTGKITTVYHDPGPNEIGNCYKCDGVGKVLKCKICGKIDLTTTHKDNAEFDGLCFDCIRAKLGFARKNSEK